MSAAILVRPSRHHVTPVETLAGLRTRGALERNGGLTGTRGRSLVASTVEPRLDLRKFC